MGTARWTFTDTGSSADGLAKIVLADPPWRYEDKAPRGAAGNHYQTMTLADIHALPVEALAAEDCALFLWVTAPLLREGLETITRWGFAYKNIAFAWVKTTKDHVPAMGLGHWTRGNVELCLFGVRGRPERVSAGVRQVIAPDTYENLLADRRLAHSQKPPRTRDRIMSLLGDLPAVELFARESVPGWESWGDEGSPTLHLTR